MFTNILLPRRAASSFLNQICDSNCVYEIIVKKTIRGGRRMGCRPIYAKTEAKIPSKRIFSHSIFRFISFPKHPSTLPQARSQFVTTSALPP